MIELSVNLNKVAWLRNARGGARPSVISAARTVINAGAYGVTVHPRPDQRHITAADVTDIAALLATDYPGTEYNIEGNPHAGPRDNGYPGFSSMIETTRPHQCTLVPDGDSQLTSDHGWDLTGDTAGLREAIAHYQSFGARVSLFMSTDLDQIDRAAAIGADRIELYTGPFAAAISTHGSDSPAAQTSLNAFAGAARHAASIGLGVNAGHDLDLDNLPVFARIDQVQEVSIGHALIADALDLGLDGAVRAYLKALTRTEMNPMRDKP